jgi:quinol monooxygenase YgiN
MNCFVEIRGKERNTRSRPSFISASWQLQFLMIIVVATIQLHPSTRDAFLVEFRNNLAAVRAEQGCVEYFPAIDHATNLPAQAAIRDDIVVVIEKWASTSALEAHLIAPHMISYRTKVKDFVKQVSLQVLEPAE